MLCDNSLRLHGIIGGSGLKKEDDPNRFKMIYKSVKFDGTKFYNAIMDTGVTGDKCMLFQHGGIIYRMELVNASTIGNITEVVTVPNSYKIMRIASTPMGFASWHYTSSRDIEMVLYTENGYVKIREQSSELSYSNTSDYGIVGDPITEQTTFCLYANSGNQSVITLNQNGNTVSNLNPGSDSNFPDLRENAIAYDGMIYCQTKDDRELLKFRTNSRSVISRSMAHPNQVVTDPKYGFVFRTDEGVLYKTSDFTQETNNGMSALNFFDRGVHRTCPSPHAGYRQVWADKNGVAYDVGFSTVKNPYNWNKNIPTVRYMSEIFIERPTAYNTIMTSPKSKTLLCFNGWTTGYLDIYTR